MRQKTYLRVILTTMKIFLFISLLIFGGCTMYTPPDIRAKNIIIHYLDSVNKPNKIELFKIIKIENSDIDNSSIYSQIKSDSIKTDSEKQLYRNLLDSANKINKPNGFFCNYRINGIEHATVIRLDRALSKVIQVTKLSN